MKIFQENTQTKNNNARGLLCAEIEVPKRLKQNGISISQGGAMSLHLVLVISFFLATGSAFSLATAASAPENNLKYSYYYQFADKSLTQLSFRNPADIITSAVRSATPAPGQTINLLIWNLVSKQLPLPQEPYDRDRQFGTWIVDGRQGNCLNTRGVVLVRDSSSAIGLDPANRCYVQSGTWFDPYTNTQFKGASQVQIDHFVPLKHVYISGGFKWDARTKCLYANYTGYRTHLMAVSATENMKKGDATPYSYLPPNRSFTCAYLVNWLKIKKIWNLDLIPPETQAIAEAYKTNYCDAKLFNMSVEELYAQRKYMNDNYRLCDSDVGGPFRKGVN